MINTLFNRFREVLRSREVFRNWLSAAIHYAFTNPRACINVSCRSGGRVCIDPALYAYVIRGFYLGLIHEVTCDKEDNALVIDGLKVKLTYNDDYFDLGSAKFKHSYVPIFHVFHVLLHVFAKQEYGLVDVRGRVIVDVGAFVGDSAIYFVLKGARKVYAIEPHPGAYAEMLENIKLNNMQDKIVPINVAIGSKPGRAKIPNNYAFNKAITYYESSINKDTEVSMVTLEQIINNYKIEPDVLKMDCEGCEFDLILNDYEHVRLFKELIFEYHEGDGRKLANLLIKLSNDYKCKVINEGSVGMVHCVKLNL